MTDELQDLDTILAYSYAHSDQGQAYIPAKQRDNGLLPTVDKVKISLDNLWDVTNRAQNDYYLAKGREAQEYLKDTELLEAIKASALTIADNHKYGIALRDALMGVEMHDGGVIKPHVGILASLVSVYAGNQRKAKRERVPAVEMKDYLGQPGDLLTNLNLSLQTVRYWEGRGDNITTLLVGRTDTGLTAMWEASRFIDVVPGDKLVLRRATIKGLGEHEGTPQTILYRAQTDTIVHMDQ